MFIKKLKKISSTAALVLLSAGLISGCSNLSLKGSQSSPSVTVQDIVMQEASASTAVPGWIESLIKDLNTKPVKDSPESIASYSYKGKTVYYFAPACCGQMSNLYDEHKKLLCRPDGGSDGQGDRKCPEFMAERSNLRLIWEENRD